MLEKVQEEEFGFAADSLPYELIHSMAKI